MLASTVALRVCATGTSLVLCLFCFESSRKRERESVCHVCEKHGLYLTNTNSSRACGVSCYALFIASYAWPLHRGSDFLSDFCRNEAVGHGAHA